MYRWTLLKHERMNDQIFDVHYDFLLENGQDCKTWKLLNLPKLDGPSVEIFNHSKAELERRCHIFFSYIFIGGPLVCSFTFTKYT